jgi:flavorubredoxin
MVVYDSVFGNTAQVARAIGAAWARTVPVNKVDGWRRRTWRPRLLAVGSPTLGLSPHPRHEALPPGDCPKAA